MGTDCHPRISVVICSHNRAPFLTVSLGSLVRQSLDATEFEIIVVDNLSNDDTNSVVDKFSKLYPNIRYFFEPCLGLSYARNRGWQEARGQYVAYTDDDCRLPRQWLEVAKGIIKEISPGVFGGPIYSFYNSPKPHWYKDSYGARGHGDRALNLGKDQFLSGGNIFFGRELIRRLGGFDVHFGMSGTTLGYGEETALQKEIHSKIKNEIIYYDPRLYVYHLVRANKMSMKWLIRQRFVSGRYWHRVKNRERSFVGMKRYKIVFQALKTIGSLAFDVPRSIKRNRVRYRYFQNYIYEISLARLALLGELYERYQCTLQNSKIPGSK